MRLLKILAGAAIAAAVATNGQAQDTKPTVLALNFTPYGLHLGVYAAKEQGYFKDEGLNVDIQRGYGSGDTAKRVATGTADFGFSDAASVIAGQGSGLGIKMVGCLLDLPFDNIYYGKWTGIEKPSDMEGHSLAAAPGEMSLNLFPAFAASAGIDPSKVKIVNVDVTAKYSSLFSKRVDAIGASVTGDPLVATNEKKLGIDVDQFIYSDYGLDYYSIGMIVSGKTLNERPEFVQKMLRAILKGYAYAYRHPAEATADFSANFPELSATLSRKQWDIAQRYILSDRIKEHGIGYLDKTKMEHTIDLMKGFLNVSDDIDVNDVMDTTNLPEVKVD